MSFTPILPVTGLAGFRFLEETRAQQLDAVAADPVAAGALDNFRENIASVESADDLLADRALLEVALTAFGLEEEIDSTAILRRALEEGSDDPEAFANSLADARFADLAQAFGFGDAGAGFDVTPFEAAVELRFRPTDAGAPPAVSQADITQFRATIGSVQTVDDLLADPQTLDVALAAFGVERGFFNDNFFRQLIEEGPQGQTAINSGDLGFVSFAAAFEGLASDGTVSTGPRFALDVEREIARRGIELVSPELAAGSQSLISSADVTAFNERIGSVESGADLVADETLRRVTLVAFGFQQDSISDADLIAVLDGGDQPGSAAFTVNDGAFLQLATSFQNTIDVDVPSFERAVEVGLTLQGLDAGAPNQAEPTPEISEEDLAFFRDNVRGIESAADLVANERLLDIALTAFGLENSGFSDGFFQSLLESDPDDPTSFANITGDQRLRDFFEAFNPGTGGAPVSVLQLEVDNRLIANNASAEDIAFFRENFNVDFISDPQLRDITLSAFGIGAGEFSDSFILSVLSSDTSDPRSFVNLFNDERLSDFASVFGINTNRGNTGLQSFQDDIATRYIDRLFEVGVGDTDTDARIALQFQREIGPIASSASVETSGYLQLLGSQPLRTFIEGVFGLPQEFAQLDIDAQVRDLEARTLEAFGGSSPSVFLDPDTLETAIERFFLNREIANGPSGAAASSPVVSLVADVAARAGAINITA